MSSRFPVPLSNRRDTVFPRVFLANIFSAFLAANDVAKYTDCKLSDVAYAMSAVCGVRSGETDASTHCTCEVCTRTEE